MSTINRWYLYLVCLISVQAVVWAIIALLRDLLLAGNISDAGSIAFESAVILVGLPIFLGHWLWARRLATHDVEERTALVSSLYFYVTLSAFLIPILYNGYDLLAGLLALPFGADTWRTQNATPTDALLRDLIAVVVLAVFWGFHRYVLATDEQAAPLPDNNATLRRLYLFIFSGTGLTMVALALIQLLRWLFFHLGGSPDVIVASPGFTNAVARLLVGLPLFLLCWLRVQRLFNGPDEDEHVSALRKCYLYTVVFVSALITVANLTILLAGGLRRLLGLPAEGDARLPLAIIIVLSVVWVYHALVLRDDAARVGEAPKQAAIRRLYWYLVAAVGLAAVLVGISGDISVLISVIIGESTGGDILLREKVAWFTAAFIAGLPVWLGPWRKAQHAAELPAPDGSTERASLARKIYLYFYLFVAALTVLSSMIYIVYRFLRLLLGVDSDGSLLGNLAEAMAFALIGVGLWLYHWSVLRADQRRLREDEAARLRAVRVAVLDGGTGAFGRAVCEALRREMPGLTLIPLGVTPEAAAALGGAFTPDALADATMIVSPGILPMEASQAVHASAARKVLVPIAEGDAVWVGVERWHVPTVVGQVVQVVRQLIDGTEISIARPLSVGAIIAIIIGVLVLLILLAIPVLFFFSRSW